ncbi:porin [Pelagibaculum spongiae]|uniref:Porin n=1 Tax=Pelagibaculum spongiae TaxID=2080658 RepID=A0A2V1GWU8_9GAMM|nr:porin [Pelagibaculum spongiae]PVZ63908.1 porin [Pelagibaculum spongiae]
MNKIKLTALAVVAAISLPTMATAAPKVYGKLSVTVQNSDIESNADGDKWEIKSNASRIGFKGDAELDAGLTGIYKIEYEIDNIDKTKSSSEDIFKARATWVGLKGDFGTVIVGREDTPLKKSQKKVDLFNDLSGDIKNVLKGDNRESNIIQYTSPKIADAVKIKLMTQFGEGEDIDGETGNEDGLFDVYSVSAAYNKDGIYAAIAYDSGIDEQEILRLTGQVNLGDLQLGAMWQDAEPTDGSADSEDGYHVSAAYKLGKAKLKAQYTASDIKAAGADQFSVGAEYKLGKKTTAHGFYTAYDADAADSGKDFYGVGIIHKF